jgi:hypothetical protein
MLRGVFRQGDCGRQLPTVRGALTEMDHAVQQIRDRNMLAGLPFEAPLRVLDLVDRYHATADVEGYLQVGDFSNDHASTGMIQTSWSMVLDGIWSDKSVLRTMRETGLCDLRSQLAEENDPKLKAVP